MEVVEPRIFIYLRLSCEGEVLVKSKIREFRALGSLLADMMGLVVKKGIHGREKLSAAVFEYVDANTDKVLLRLRSDNSGLVVSGHIPRDYQKRMLSPENHHAIGMENFIQRAGRELDEIEKQKLSHMATQQHHSLLEMIRKNIDGDDFEFRIGPGAV
jgi:hypothetical protein